MQRREIDALLNSLEHLVVHARRLLEQFPAMNDAMSHRVNIGRLPDLRNDRLFRRNISDQIVESRANVLQLGGHGSGVILTMRDLDCRGAPDPLDLAAADPGILLLMPFNPFRIYGDDLE